MKIRAWFTFFQCYFDAIQMYIRQGTSSTRTSLYYPERSLPREAIGRLSEQTLKSSFDQGAFSLKPRTFSREQLKFTKSLVSGDWKQELDSGLLFCAENRHVDLSLFSYVLGVTSFF